MKKYNAADVKSWTPCVRAGEEIYLSGIIYTARDAAHKKIYNLLLEGKPLPFELDGATVYYASPAPKPEGSTLAVGSCGPTTSGRMDVYTPYLLDNGLACMMGKGDRTDDVVEAIIRNKAAYLCAIGGAGALASKCIVSAEEIAFPELGCESVKRMVIKDFPLFVAIDCAGGNIYRQTANKNAAV